MKMADDSTPRGRRAEHCFCRNRKPFLAILATVGLVPISLWAATLCVWTNSPFPGEPYNDWTNAARDIQTAVDFAEPGDTVLVTNGIYAAGGRSVYGIQSNRVVINKPIVVRSVNGPEVTRIEGADQTRCVYVGTNAVLEGFWLQFGNTRSVGDRAREQSGGARPPAACDVAGVTEDSVTAQDRFRYCRNRRTSNGKDCGCRGCCL